MNFHMQLQNFSLEKSKAGFTKKGIFKFLAIIIILIGFTSITLTVRCQHIDNRIFATIASVNVNIPDETVVGKINGSSWRFGRKRTDLYLGAPNNLDHKIINAFDNSDIISFNEMQNYEDISPAIKPKLILQANIMSIDFDLHGKRLKDLAGPCNIVCQWQIFTVDDPKHAKKSIVQQTHIERKKGDDDLIFNDLITASSRQLLTNDTLLIAMNSYLANYLNGLSIPVTEISNCKTISQNDSRSLLKQAMNGVVTIIGSNDFGSGTIVSQDGYIITNYHVTAGEKKLKIKTHSGEILQASLIKSNIDYDIALLKVDGKLFTCLPLATGYVPEAGDNIFALGTPLDQQFGQSVSKGIVSGNRKINGISFIQTDVSLNNGNSGGPLVNENGEVVGIVTMKMAGSGIEGLGFCIAIDEVIKALHLTKSSGN